MSYRATITLDEDAFSFLKAMGGKNRSAFVNRLLKEEKRRWLAKAILRANQEEAEDEAYQQMLAEWDDTLMDGLAP